MKKANLEEIWRRYGWVPPSKEDPRVIKRQAESRKEVVCLPTEEPLKKEPKSEEH